MMPIKIVHRKTESPNKKQEAYILGNGKFVATRTSGASSSYFEDVQSLFDKITTGEMKTLGEARFLRSLR